MYPNQGGYPNQQFNAPFGSNFPQPGAQVPYPQGQGMQMPQPQQMPSYGGYPSQQPYPQQYPNAFPSAGYPPQAGISSVYPPQAGMPNAFPPQGGVPNAFPPQGGIPNAYSPQGGFVPSQNSFSSPASTGIYPQIPVPNYGGNQSYNQSPYGSNEMHIQQQYAPSFNQAAPSSAGTIRKGRPTVTAFPGFDASNDAAALRKAMKGFGTDENAIINILCRRPNYQRVEIVRAYKTAYGKDLINDIKSETSGNFEKLLVALLTPTFEYYCQELYTAMSGAGTDEDVLVEVMCTMSNAEIKQIGALYYRMYGRSLEETLRSDTSGNVKRLYTSLSVGGRDESMITNIESARNDAQALKKAGVDRWGTDESEFNRILCLRNYEQLKLICEEYKKLTGNTLEKDIKKEFSGDIEDALLSIIRVATNRPEFFARRCHKSMAGLGTNDRSLIRLCVTRSEIDMMDVKDEFQRYYSKTLKSFIKGDTSGHYKNALYALCGESRD